MASSCSPPTPLSSHSRVIWLSKVCTMNAEGISLSIFPLQQVQANVSVLRETYICKCLCDCLIGSLLADLWFSETSSNEELPDQWRVNTELLPWDNNSIVILNMEILKVFPNAGENGNWASSAWIGGMSFQPIHQYVRFQLVKVPSQCSESHFRNGIVRSKLNPGRT